MITRIMLMRGQCIDIKRKDKLVDYLFKECDIYAI